MSPTRRHATPGTPILLSDPQVVFDPDGGGDGVAMIRLRGEADLHAVPSLRDVLRAALAAEPTALVVDLTGVTFIDSMMLGALLSATRRARENATVLRIAADHPHVRRIFEVTLLDQVMELFPTVEAALSGGPPSGEGRDRVLQRPEDGDEAIEGRDLEHALHRGRRRDEGELPAGVRDSPPPPDERAQRG